MNELEEIRNRARRDLIIPTGDGGKDVFLWERSARITDTAFRIYRLREAEHEVHELVLAAVGLYHDAGWVVQVKDRSVRREAVACRLTTPMQRELGADLMEHSLVGLLPNGQLHHASQAIRMLSDHDVDLPEARIVAEADNLDAFGALAFWNLARKHSADGKGLANALETWRTQKQYGYWMARINDSLRFPEVREIARRRLEVFDQMMQHLAAHHQGDDIGVKVPPLADAR